MIQHLTNFHPILIPENPGSKRFELSKADWTSYSRIKFCISILSAEMLKTPDSIANSFFNPTFRVFLFDLPTY
ncbi:hypothetical protein LEP1GSC058_0499 [Leptospira fainei serovar Hurstbridge str. BUT 6]|uniref:Uncharacterized protein n=1 Tax=Leptospira fainei serovar Hurstbridge str. BUT 6 TaxID=1193011 RepID=S3V380_9LEPT|nr:hypothetical protein LEP1GSC058_0499 [Leptospira fainei serovar Hurstbridge str. BUT 6]